MATAAVIAGLLVASDAVIGLMLQGRGSCQTPTGVDVRVNPSSFPLTSGVFTGSVGPADVFVPWSAIERAAQVNAPTGLPLTVVGRDGLVVVETQLGPLPVMATLQPGIDAAGHLDLAVVGLNVAGRDVSPDVAGELSDSGGSLQTGSLLRGAVQEIPFEISGLDVRDDGIELEARLPLSVITRSNSGSGCGFSPG